MNIFAPALTPIIPGRWLRAAALLLPVCAFAAPVAPDVSVLEAGLTQSCFSNVNRNDALVAYRALLENLGTRLGYRMRAAVQIYDDSRQLAAALDQRPIHIAVMDSWQFLELEARQDIRPMFVPIVDGQVGRRYLVLARRGSGLRSVADLRGRAVVRLESLDNQICRRWLESLLPDEPGSPAADFVDALENAAKPAAAVLPVFFGKKAACIVDERGLELMKEMNPQVGKVLEVIATSELFTDSVLCLSDLNWVTPTAREDTIRVLGNLGGDPAGRQILTLFRISGQVPFQEGQLATVRALYHSRRKFPAPGPAAVSFP